MPDRDTVELTAHDSAFVDAQVAAGEYDNASEVVRAGLRLLERRQLRIYRLRLMIAEGDADYARGEYEVFEPGELAASLIEGLRRRHGSMPG